MPRSIGPLLEAIDIFLRATNLRQLRRFANFKFYLYLLGAMARGGGRVSSYSMRHTYLTPTDFA
jgi:hypothetical protein